MAKDLDYADYLVLVGFLSTSVFIGMYQSSKSKNTGVDFINGERKLKLLPTVLSMMVSFHSAILILGNVAEIYRWGGRRGRRGEVDPGSRIVVSWRRCAFAEFGSTDTTRYNGTAIRGKPTVESDLCKESDDEYND